jgi:hypothetical protein
MRSGDTFVPKSIIAGLVPAIFFVAAKEDARDTPGHDGVWDWCLWR